jgi:hypothetical protein
MMMFVMFQAGVTSARTSAKASQEDSSPALVANWLALRRHIPPHKPLQMAPDFDGIAQS